VSWAAAFRARFRHHPAAIGLRAVRRAGWRGLLADAPLARRILATAPVRTDGAAGAPVEVHLLCHRHDHLLAIWALKTFYHFSSAPLPLAIHLQGRVSRRLVERLRAHFPAAWIIPQAEADARVGEALQGLPRLLRARAANPICMKVTDFVVLGAAPRVLGVDSDVLFFAPPAALLAAAAGAGSLFQRDLATRYTVSPGDARAWFGVEPAPRVNTGLMAFTRDPADLARCERYLSHPGVAARSGVLEQTLHALCAAERGGPLAYLAPDDYLISLEPGGDYAPLVARHYAGSSRRMVGDGMRWLEARGVLREMGA
jgi:hypothetical protein